MSTETNAKEKRAELRARFLSKGLGEMTEREILSLFLSFTVQLGDVSELADTLLSRFGSISAVFAASDAELTDAGLSEHAAILARSVFAVRSENTQRTAKGRRLDTFERCGEFFRSCYIGAQSEYVMMATLDSDYRILSLHSFREGGISFAECSVRMLAERVMERGVVFAVLAHNHPKGQAIPSEEDITATAAVYRALGQLNVTLIDHVLVSGADYASVMRYGVGGNQES
ncbi:MAG: JAB domain-containing protein [Clostridia bacterium]|nr:JAB domain-containing protein [Clostridia bacterium]